MRTSTQLTLAVVGLLLIGAAGTASAQTTLKLIADIPFEFTVGSKTLPAGTYAVDREWSNIIAFRSANATGAAFVIANPAQATAIAEQAKLVFNRYGNRYFLAQLWTASGNWGYEIPKDRSQRELAQRAANHERVMILAKR
ncbi:MAG: hypothetical protein FJW34_13905 [Acidobacteria bacterium]|nr:hypothetical protein [Acidobacteriota bacterium]